jgi:microcystin-dependent protein
LETKKDLIMKSRLLSKCRVAIFSLIAFLSSSGWATIIEGNLEVKARSGANGDLTIEGTTTTGSLTVNGVSNASVPSGVIVMWSGEIDAIPDGWALCNGENETPNLSGRFVVGYDASNDEYGDISSFNKRTGGSDSRALTQNNMPAHTHAVDGGSHTHSFPGENGSGGDGVHRFAMPWLEKNEPDRASGQGNGGTHSHTISTAGKSENDLEAFDNRPAYYVLAYIIKL